jgi:hypothetical protein
MKAELCNAEHAFLFGRGRNTQTLIYVLSKVSNAPVLRHISNHKPSNIAVVKSHLENLHAKSITTPTRRKQIKELELNFEVAKISKI